MGRRELVVLRVDGVELPREPLERGVAVAEVQLARLLERREGFRDAADGELVGLDVEVVDGVVDELGSSSSLVLACMCFLHVLRFGGIG
jgi:ABC-type amino acid transport substrate-binding protein